MSNSITTKVLFSVFVVTVIVLGIVSLVSVLTLKSQESTKFDTETKDISKQLAVIMVDPIFSYDTPVLQKIVDSYLPNALISSIVINDQKDREMVSVASKRNVDHTDEIPITYSNGKHIGTILVSYSRDEINKVLAFKVTETIVNMVLTLGALCACLFFIIQQVLVKPITRVSKTIDDMTHNGQFDLTVRAPSNSNDEVGTLAENFNSLLDAVSKTLQDVSNNINQFSAWITKFDVIRQNTSDNTGKQQRLTQDSLNHLQELQHAINGIVTSTEVTATDCKETLNVANERKRDVDQNLKIVSELVEELDVNASKANELKAASNTIAGVLDVIKNIAEQTNLLALNAAIEAARAGESGRGFAVVADEVRTLAQRTQESTSEIESIIAELQNKTEESFEGTQRGQSMVKEAITLTENSAKSYTYISEKMHSINTMIQEIVSAAEQQFALSNEVNKHMEDVLNGSESLASEIMQMSENSAQVSHAERNLQEDLSRFNF